jgi:hypothetical protein
VLAIDRSTRYCVLLATQLVPREWTSRGGPGVQEIGSVKVEATEKLCRLQMGWETRNVYVVVWRGWSESTFSVMVTVPETELSWTFWVSAQGFDVPPKVTVHVTRGSNDSEKVNKFDGRLTW